jgi:hypothetical protein
MTTGTYGQEVIEIHLQFQVYLNDLSFSLKEYVLAVT